MTDVEGMHSASRAARAATLATAATIFLVACGSGSQTSSPRPETRAATTPSATTTAKAVQRLSHGPAAGLAKEFGLTLAACIELKLSPRLTDDQWAAIGVTASGVDMNKLNDESFKPNPSTVVLWDATFACVGPDRFLDDLDPTAGPAERGCLQSSILDNKLLRLGLVLGTTDGDLSGLPPIVQTLGARIDAAVSVCQARTKHP